MARQKREQTPEVKSGPQEIENIYFDDDDDSSIEYFPSGCTVLDCALGGGWALNRFINIYGQSGSGKTLLLIEAAINYRKKFSEVPIYYAETEHAFDTDYAHHLGLSRKNFTLQQEVYTVEDLSNDFEAFIEKNSQGLYVVDSWDALSDKAELERAIDDPSYGAAKARKISETFRRLNSRIQKSNITLISVSQVRDNIGVSYGRKYTRSGGRALQFYGSQILTINEKEKLKKTIDKVTRVVGIISEIKVEKNKAGTPFRSCQVPIYFGYGIDNLEAGLDWLAEEASDEVFDELGLTKSGYPRSVAKWRAEGNPELEKKVDELVIREWNLIEDKFRIGRSKYAKGE